MAKSTLLCFVHISSFLNWYFREHSRTGVMGIRLCSLRNLGLGTISTDKQYKLFVNWIIACMVDAPECGFELCTWIYNHGNVAPVISMCDPKLTVVKKGQEKPTIHESIARHVKEAANGAPIVAFQVTFFDGVPSHKWLFVVE